VFYLKIAPFYRDTWVEVRLDHIYDNVKAMRHYLQSDKEIMAVVKANAYGHGDVQVAQAAIKAGASYLAVAFLDEAISLREKGISHPILVMGAVRATDVVIAAEKKITLTVFQKEWLNEVLTKHDLSQKLTLHVKIDTGMNRLGLKDLGELKEIIQIIQQYGKNFELEGLYTHFATADELDTSYFYFQYERLEKALNYLEELNVHVPIIHCGNSATGLRFPDKVFNMVRMGIAMYGLSPSNEIKDQLPFPLREAFSLHSKIVHVKKIQPGEKISYGATYSSDREEWIGTIPVGYADGWIRKLNTRSVIVDGERVPIVGRVCMDQFMVRLPNRVDIGTKVTLIGEQASQLISVDEIASELGTINYEIPCMISYRVPRIYKELDSIVEVQNYLL
jgi:alanine racemase